MNTTYIRLLQTIESFAAAHMQVKKFGSDFPDNLPQFATANEAYPVLFVSPSSSVLNPSTSTYDVLVYCYDVTQKDRENINSILSDTAQILSDLDKWLRYGDLAGISLSRTSTLLPINNATLDYAAGWVMSLSLDVTTYSVCEIPFSESPTVIGMVNDIVYSQYLTCETLSECEAIVDMQDQINALSGGTGIDCSELEACPVITGITASIQQNLEYIGELQNEVGSLAQTDASLQNQINLLSGTTESQGLHQVLIKGNTSNKNIILSGGTNPSGLILTPDGLTAYNGDYGWSLVPDIMTVSSPYGFSLYYAGGFQIDDSGGSLNLGPSEGLSFAGLNGAQRAYLRNSYHQGEELILEFPADEEGEQFVATRSWVTGHTISQSTINALSAITTAHTASIAALSAVTTGHTTSIASNTASIAALSAVTTAHTASIASHTSSIAALSAVTTAHTVSIASNTAAISALSAITTAHTASISANTAAIATKQATLVSGTNIKTINSLDLLGSGDLDYINELLIKQNWGYMLPNPAATTYSYLRSVTTIQTANLSSTSLQLPPRMTYFTGSGGGTPLLWYQRGTAGGQYTFGSGVELYFKRKFTLRSTLLGTASRMFIGLSAQFTVSNPTNVEPTTLINCIGLAKLSSSQNLHIVWNDATGTASSFDLGTDYQLVVNTQFAIEIRKAATSSDVVVTIYKSVGGVVTSTSLSISSDLNISSSHYPVMYGSNNTDFATATLEIDDFGIIFRNGFNNLTLI